VVLLVKWLNTKEKASGAKCKVNWETACRPKIYGGLGILHLEKFASALRMRWPWLEWKGKDKIWVGMGNPCSKEDMNLFYAANTITLGNGEKHLFGTLLGSMIKSPKILPLCILSCARERIGSSCKPSTMRLGLAS
jgi:hypothetical protein